MKKTVFVGKVNDQEFDNVQDYNACVQAMLDMGKDFQATSSTQVVETPDEGQCHCNQCTCGKEDPQKSLKPVTSMLPAYEDKDGGKYIQAIKDAYESISRPSINAEAFNGTVKTKYGTK